MAIKTVTLSDKELEDIRKEAERLEVEEEKKRLKDRALADERQRLRAAIDPSEETRSITIDLADYADRITIDGRIYVHGQTYVVPKRLFDVLSDAMFQTQRHEHEISGKRRDQFKPRMLAIGPTGAISSLARAAGA